MGKQFFQTLPDELQTAANRLLEELKHRGYRVKIEPNALELPATPTILAKRSHENSLFPCKAVCLRGGEPTMASLLLFLHY